MKKPNLNTLSKNFIFHKWNIGISNLKQSHLIQNKIIDDYDVIWVDNCSKLSFKADPFFIEINNLQYLIFEEYSEIKKRGRIAIAEIKNQKLINKRIIIDDKKHLSYPYIFKSQNEIFVICESYKSGQTILYKINQQNLSAEKVKEIFADFGVIDPVLIFYNHKYWLFYSKSKRPTEELYIAYSDNLYGDFIQHPKNPVKICKKSSRNAGEIFIFNNELYRPSQNCENFYGEKITLNKIIALDENNYVDELWSEILPSKKYPKIKGIHTISIAKNYIVIDGLSKTFYLYKPLISLIRNLIRIYSKLKKKFD